MTRGLTAAQISHIESENIRPTWLAVLDFPSGIVRVTTAPMSLFFDHDLDLVEEEFLGVGAFGGITAVEENIDGRAHAIELTLSLVDASLISIALAEHIQGRPGQVWAAWLDENNDFIGDPQPRFTGIMDTMPFKFNADGKSGLISVRVISRDANWESPNRTPRYTHQDHKARFADDDFYIRLPQINGGSEVAWGVDF